MIKAVTGRPGEGKTCFAVQHIIIMELIKGKRAIYSNIEWHEKELEEFCLRLGYEIDVSRLKMIEQDNIDNFWNFVKKDSLVVLDEVAEHFNSQHWNKIKDEAGSYGRQHRKMGHEVYFVVQDLSHIYKQFRDLIQEEICLTNLHQKKLLGFPMPKVFIANFFYCDQRMQIKPYQKKFFRFDVRVFECYNTLAVVGGLLSGIESQDETFNETAKNQKGFKRFFFHFKDKVGSFLGPIGVVTLIVGGIFCLYNLPGFLMNRKPDIAINSSFEEEPKNVENVEKTNTNTGGYDRKRVGNLANLGRYNQSTKRSLLEYLSGS